MTARSAVFASSVCLILLGAASAFAQSSAPRETVQTRVGRAQVSIEYGRPALKGRNVASLMKQLPDDRMWRAGAEEVTTLTATAPVSLGGKILPAGKYSLYVHCPDEGPYSLAVNRDLGQPLKKVWAAAPPQVADAPYPHFNYRSEIGSQEVLRVPMKRTAGNDAVDLFTISLTPGDAGAYLKMAWGDQVWSLDLQPAASARTMPEGSHF